MLRYSAFGIQMLNITFDPAVLLCGVREERWLINEKQPVLSLDKTSEAHVQFPKFPCFQFCFFLNKPDT